LRPQKGQKAKQNFLGQPTSNKARFFEIWPKKDQPGNPDQKDQRNCQWVKIKFESCRGELCVDMCHFG